MIQTTNSVFSFFYLILTAMGVPGNILMFIVFSRKTLTKLSVSMYFRAMSISNLFICILMIKRFLDIQYDVSFLLNHSVIFCKGYYFVICSLTSMAAWLLATADLDRFLGIAYPTRFKFIQNGCFPLYVAIAITVYNLMFYVQVIETNYVNKIINLNNSTRSVCDISSNFFYTSDLINSAIIPFSLMISSTIGMFLVVYNSQKRMKHFKHSNSNNKKDRRNAKFVVSLIITNIVVLILKIPDFIFLNFFASDDFNLHTFLSLMFYSVYSIEFYLQLVVNKLVRNEFMSIVLRFWNLI